MASLSSSQVIPYLPKTSFEAVKAVEVTTVEVVQAFEGRDQLNIKDRPTRFHSKSRGRLEVIVERGSKTNGLDDDDFGFNSCSDKE